MSLRRLKATHFYEGVAAMFLVGALWWIPHSGYVAPVHVAAAVVVIVDPGHGGQDPGAVGVNGMFEKHINLSVAHALQHALASQGIVVYLTRTADYSVNRVAPYSVRNDLLARSRLVRKYHAAIFITIHSNAEPTHTMRGPIVYYDRDSLSSARLADRVAHALNAALGYARPPRPIQQLVLEEAGVPAINVEVGFVSHRGDSAMLTSPQYQETLAKAIASGILQYLNQGMK